MKLNFTKHLTTGRVLVVLYLLLCFVEGYNIYPIVNLTNQSIQRYDSIAAISNQKLNLINDLRKNSNFIQSKIFRHLHSNSAIEMSEQERQIDLAFEDNSAILDEYQKMVESAEEQKLLDTVLYLREVNMAARDEVIELSSAGDQKKGIAYYATTQETTRLNYSDAVEVLTDYIVRYTYAQLAETEVYIKTERVSINLLLALSVLLAIVTGVVVIYANKKLNVQNMQLSEQERKFRTIVETTDEMIFNVNKSGEITWANRSAKTNLKYGEEEISNLKLSEITENGSNDSLRNDIMDGDSDLNTLGTLAAKGGEIVHVEGKAIPLEEKGHIMGTQVFFRNVTAKKWAEERLRDTSVQLEHVLNIFDHSFWGADVMNNKMLYVSPGNEKVFGYPEKEFMENGDLWFQIVMEEDKGKFGKAWELLHQGKSAIMEFRINHPTEGIKWIESKMAPTLDGAGKLVRVDGLAIDISERKQFEQELEENNRVLQTINSELDRFVYSTSHDLRAPLLSLEGLLNLSDEHIESQNDIRQYHQSMRRVISQMDETIKEILDYSRNARIDVKPERLNIKQMALTIKDNISHITERTNIKFSAHIEEAVPFFSDKSRVSAIINNLISNAYKYTRNDEPNPYVKFSFSSTPEEGIIKVEDNGEGISDEYKEKIFEMFFRASERYEGSGLGLYICREIVKRLHGSIEVQSLPLQGSTFIVKIPNAMNKSE